MKTQNDRPLLVSGFHRGLNMVLFDLFDNKSTRCDGPEYRGYQMYGSSQYSVETSFFLCEKDLKVLPEGEH